MCGFIAQLVEHRTGIAEVTGSNPVEALIFYRLLLSNCIINRDDQSSFVDWLFRISCGSVRPVCILYREKSSLVSYQGCNY